MARRSSGGGARRGIDPLEHDSPDISRGYEESTYEEHQYQESPYGERQYAEPQYQEPASHDYGDTSSSYEQTPATYRGHEAPSDPDYADSAIDEPVTESRYRGYEQPEPPASRYQTVSYDDSDYAADRDSDEHTAVMPAVTEATELLPRVAADENSGSTPDGERFAAARFLTQEPTTSSTSRARPVSQPEPESDPQDWYRKPDEDTRPKPRTQSALPAETRIPRPRIRPAPRPAATPPASRRRSAPAAARAAVRTLGLTKTYGTGRTMVTALDHIDLTIDSGTFTAIMGPSGSGKSTLMHCLAGLDTVSSGHVFLGEHQLDVLDDRRLTQVRRDHIGFVFQGFNLLPTLTARENILLPLDLAGRKPDEQHLAQLVDSLGLAKRLHHRPSEMSGGQQQRVAVARALVTRPEVVFADEPTGALDRRRGRLLLDYLRSCVDQTGQTIIMVTHDAKAAAYADRALILVDGQVVDDIADPTAQELNDSLDRLED